MMGAGYRCELCPTPPGFDLCGKCVASVATLHPQHPTSLKMVPVHASSPAHYSHAVQQLIDKNGHGSNAQGQQLGSSALGQWSRPGLPSRLLAICPVSGDGVPPSAVTAGT